MLRQTGTARDRLLRVGGSLQRSRQMACLLAAQSSYAGSREGLTYRNRGGSTIETDIDDLAMVSVWL